MFLISPSGEFQNHRFPRSPSGPPRSPVPACPFTPHHPRPCSPVAVSTRLSPLISARVYGTSGGGMRPAIIINLARSLPLSPRACRWRGFRFVYVTAVKVCDPSAAPSDDPHSWPALRPNISQSFKARFLVPISIHGINPRHAAESDPVSAPCLTSRRVPPYRSAIGAFRVQNTMETAIPFSPPSSTQLWPRRTMIGSPPPVMEGAHQATLPFSAGKHHTSPPSPRHCSAACGGKEKNPFRHGDPNDHQATDGRKSFLPLAEPIPPKGPPNLCCRALSPNLPS